MSGLIPFNKNNNLSETGLENFYNMLDDFFNDSFPKRNLQFDTFKLDIQEEDKQYVVEAELPGIKKEEIDLSLSEGKLTISVEHKENSEDKGKNYIHKERRFSSMKRTIILKDANSDQISARLDDGLLRITITKVEKVESTKKINVE
ncbi:MAG: Hsp20/alpha crystallin family protein [Clostridia bacterium]